VTENEPPPNRPRAGWCPDPAGGEDFRWWDGTAWTGWWNGTAWTDAVRRSNNATWRAWLTTSAAAVRVSRAVMAAAGAGILIAAVIVLLTLVRARPLPGLVLLVIAAVPALLAGQLWAIAVMKSRVSRGSGGWLQRSATTVGSGSGMRQVVLGTLRARAVYPLVTFCFLGWLAAMSGILALRNGSPNRRHVGGVRTG
jgi:Protein of unknown function (DUF2510)